MPKDIPIVCKALLDDPFTKGPPIPVGSSDWFDWLDSPTNNSFSYAFYNQAQGYIDGFMTVRKETRQRGTLYWSVYRRQGAALRKLYLGSSAALTLDKLEEIALRLRNASSS